MRQPSHHAPSRSGPLGSAVVLALSEGADDLHGLSKRLPRLGAVPSFGALRRELRHLEHARLVGSTCPSGRRPVFHLTEAGRHEAALYVGALAALARRIERFLIIP